MKLLFICTHNRCRSILAEAITNQVSAGKIIAASAGSSPQREVHPLSLKYLQEANFNTVGLRSQSWHEYNTFSPDAILTLCDSAANEVCPVWFDDAVQVHWGLPDPSADIMDEQTERAGFKHTIDVIQRRVQRLLDTDVLKLSGETLKDELAAIAAEVR